MFVVDVLCLKWMRYVCSGCIMFVVDALCL